MTRRTRLIPQSVDAGKAGSSNGSLSSPGNGSARPVDPVQATPGRETSGAFAKVDERAMAVRAALARIPDPTDRTVLVLRFFVGLSLEEISFGLKIDEEEARERYRLSLRLMERELGGWL